MAALSCSYIDRIGLHQKPGPQGVRFSPVNLSSEEETIFPKMNSDRRFKYLGVTKTQALTTSDHLHQYKPATVKTAPKLNIYNVSK